MAPSTRAPHTATRAAWTTALTHIEPNRILVRGYPIDELMGRISFGESVYLLLTGDLPSSGIGRLVDAMLVAFVDHGATPPSTLAARNAATTGATVRGAVAAGILAFGRHYGGDALACRTRLDEGLRLQRDGVALADAAMAVADQLVKAQEMPPPGFGHRFHTRDPRAARLLQLAHELEIGHQYTQFLWALERAFPCHPALADTLLPINIDGAIAAVCGDIGLPPELADALLIISRVPGLAAHVLEEQAREAPMRAIDPIAHAYDGPAERRIGDRRYAPR